MLSKPIQSQVLLRSFSNRGQLQIKGIFNLLLSILLPKIRNKVATIQKTKVLHKKKEEERLKPRNRLLNLPQLKIIVKKMIVSRMRISCHCKKLDPI